MDVKEAIKERRSFRSLEPFEVTDDLIQDLAVCASLAPSCFNNQPWRYIFVRDAEVLEKVFLTLSKGNEWVRNSSLVVAVFTKSDLDCNVKGKEYYLFDTGLSVALLMLRATELGLVAHPIAGFQGLSRYLCNYN